MSTKRNDKSTAAKVFSIVDGGKIDLVDASGQPRPLARTNTGDIAPVLENVHAILIHHEKWAGVIAYDDFTGRVMKLKPPPFDRAELGEWLDIDDARLELWLAEQFKIRRIASDAITKAVMLAADANHFHEVRAYLNALKWDGIPRLAEFVSAWLGAVKTPYTMAVSAKWLIGAVARIYKPGAKVDNVMILEGRQGAFKSTALETLFSPWFTDAAFDMSNAQESGQIIRGKWCIELAELADFNNTASSIAKRFFSHREDRYRNPYGRKPVDVPRQCVFAGSVNPSTYLKDATGNRRYWPVAVGTIWIDKIAQDRDQLWAEAAQRYKAGEEWWERASERDLFELEQEQRYIGDAYEARIRFWLEDVDASGSRMPQVTVSQLLGDCLRLETSKWSLPEQQRIGRIMARIGWPRQRIGGRSGREWVYVRPKEEKKA